MENVIAKYESGELSDSDFVYDVYELLASKYDAVAGYDLLRESEQILVHPLELEGQVLNGGFSQYFENMYGDNVFAALASFKKIGMNEAYKIVQKVIELFPDSSPEKNEEDRIMQFDLMSEESQKKIDDLSHQFSLLEEHNAKLFIRYILENKRELV
ncbi:DMP19 family protein [Enterovibrio makurazakiensis]|uniref:DMP19 family protein n=1 Tax=Enterovibrio makurazakiensis TaxID=2910232 RepID=UPI003D24C887